MFLIIISSSSATFSSAHVARTLTLAVVASYLNDKNSIFCLHKKPIENKFSTYTRELGNVLPISCIL